MTNADIAAVFTQVADLLEFKAENPFRVRAYRNAARTIGDFPRPLAELAHDAEHPLTEVEGIGKDLAEKIVTLLDSGRLPLLDELQAEIPEGVLAMMRVPGLGPKRAATIFRELKVASLEELRTACESHQVSQLKGFGAKTEASILQGLDIAAEADQRFLWAEAEQHVEAILAHLRGCPGIQKIEAAGSFRRRKETVGDLDFLVVTKGSARLSPAKAARLSPAKAARLSPAKAVAVMDHFATFPDIKEVLLRGDTKMSVRLRGKLQVDLRVVPAESFGAALQYFTGSQAHNIVLRGLAKSRGLKINEYGLFRGEQAIAGATEEEIYAALGLPCFPPELREARREFAWAEAGELPKLVEVEDIRGDLHMHTTWTDGLGTLEQMVEAAAQRGLQYIAITDHSKRAAMVGGLNAKRLLEQWAEIDAWNAAHNGPQVLKGVECDILEEGGMDIADDVLAQADWVVGSVHFGQNQSRERITRRVVGALQNPHVSAIAHPTGRLLTRRRPYEIDMEEVFKAARDYGKCLELNAHPTRLDLDDVACAAAKDRGILIVISTDSHTLDGLASMRYGVGQARRAGLTAADVANTRPWDELKKRIGHP